MDQKLSAQNDAGYGVVYLRHISDAGEFLPVTQPHLTYDEIKEFLRSQKNKKEYMSYVTFDSIREMDVAIISSPVVKSRPLVYDANGRRFFLGESQKNFDSADRVIERECVCITGACGAGKVYVMNILEIEN